MWSFFPPLQRQRLKKGWKKMYYANIKIRQYLFVLISHGSYGIKTQSIEI